MKPCEGNFVGNALKNNVAGLNIDGCRIGTAEVLKGGSGGLLSHVRDDKPYSDENGYEPNKQGRWPANVILGHCEGCKRLGTKTVKATEGFRPNLVGVQSDGRIRFTEKPVGYKKISYSSEDGNEQVEAWECVEDCPVKAIGEQSGESDYRRPSVMCNCKKGIWNNGDGAATLRHSDTGTAARFFKQIKEVTDET